MDSSATTQPTKTPENTAGERLYINAEMGAR